MIWNTITSLVCTAAPVPRYDSYLTKNPVAFVVNGKPENPALGDRAVRRSQETGPRPARRCDGAGILQSRPLRSSAQRSAAHRPAASGGFRGASAVPHPINPALINMRQIDPNPTPRRSDLYDALPTSIRRRRWRPHYIVGKSILASPNCISRSTRPKSASSAPPSPPACRAKRRRPC
jgi:hypothetical protein